jgi:signal transduction histidine kinase
MAKCFMCGTSIAQGILCEKCDKPRRPKQKASENVASPPPAATAPQTPQPPVAAEGDGAARSSESGGGTRSQSRSSQATAPQIEMDPFPKAPILTFPIESASLAITSVVNLLVVSCVPSILLGADRTVKFVSDEAKRLFDASQQELSNLKFIESKTGVRIGELSVPATAGVRIRNRSVLYTLVPLSGGASGAVLVFRYSDATPESHASFVAYVRETVFGPLAALRESLSAMARARSGNDPLLNDAAATVDQILSSLELAPGVDDPNPSKRRIPTVTDVVHSVVERFRPFADLKGIHVQVDVQELDERLRDFDHLDEALGILMDNAMHYVQPGGQVVIGVRWMEHKNKPLLLFFVMDNGPLVPEPLRTAIFEPDFVWNPQSPERTGRSLFKAREFAVAHAGSVWVESKTGKACTFFLRVRPDATL